MWHYLVAAVFCIQQTIQEKREVLYNKQTPFLQIPSSVSLTNSRQYSFLLPSGLLHTFLAGFVCFTSSSRICRGALSASAFSFKEHSLVLIAPCSILAYYTPTTTAIYMVPNSFLQKYFIKLDQM